jgi:hypothetical protein
VAAQEGCTVEASRNNRDFIVAVLVVVSSLSLPLEFVLAYIRDRAPISQFNPISYRVFVTWRSVQYYYRYVKN